MLAVKSRPAPVVRSKDTGCHEELRTTGVCVCVCARASVCTFVCAEYVCTYSHTALTLSQQGLKHFMAIPVAFTTDHIETLYEIDVEFGEEAEKMGVRPSFPICSFLILNRPNLAYKYENNQ